MSSAETHFASPQRLSRPSVDAQAQQFAADAIAGVLLNAGLNYLFVLNSCRQIVAASRNVFPLVQGKSLDELLGQRPGEALECLHAGACVSGCGTSEFCRECGAVRAILDGLNGEGSVQECRLRRRRGAVEEALDLTVMSTPLTLNHERFTLVAVTDAGHEKRRQAFERIFFHDLINLASGAEGLLEHLKTAVPRELRRELDVSHSSVRQLLEEILAQRDLAAAERQELSVRPVSVRTDEVLTRLAGVYQHHPALNEKPLVVAHACSALLETDLVLLNRVLGNLVKNAAEASARGQTITLSCELDSAQAVCFRVHNVGVMPQHVQLQVFNRSFSTKGSGRGLGTYSVKLLTERCLKGRVSFTSTPEKGTEFCVTLPPTLD